MSDNQSLPISDNDAGMTNSESSLGKSELASSGPSLYLYFVLSWFVLIVFGFALITLVLVDRRRKRVSNQTESGDRQAEEETAENVAMTNERRRRRQVMGINFLIFGIVIAFVSSLFSILSCQFLMLDEPIESYLADESNNLSQLQYLYIGMWGVTLSSKAEFLNHQSCHEISGLFLLLDTSFHFARACSVISIFIGGISFLVVLSSFGRKRFGRLVHSLMLPFLAAFLAQLCTLAILDTESCSIADCEVGLGAIASITAALYWLFCAFVCKFISFGQS